MKNPIQPIQKDEHGTLRFKPNKIVEYLLDNGSFTMNDLACHSFSNDDRIQFAQLIGYSLNGFGELSYVDDYTYSVAESLIDSELSEDKARIIYLENKLNSLKDSIRKAIADLFEIHEDDLK